MKLSFFILVAFFYAAVDVDASVTKNAVRAAVAKCSKDAKTPPATFDALLTTRKVPDTQLEKCFMGCLYKKLSLTRNGQLNTSVAQGLVKLTYSKNKEQLKKALAIIDACKTIDAVNDECNLGFKLRECFIANSDDSFTPFLVEKSSS